MSATVDDVRHHWNIPNSLPAACPHLTKDIVTLRTRTPCVPTNTDYLIPWVTCANISGRAMQIYTIGFTKKTAAEFFGALRRAGIKRLIDVRLNNISQLAGFAKQQDLAFFLSELCDARYVHEPLLAPTAAMLDVYRKHGGDWTLYEQRFTGLLHERQIETRLDRSLFSVPAVLLCSEALPTRCHRRLVAEYLAQHWPDVTIAHL